jgi:hypothetical protein
MTTGAQAITETPNWATHFEGSKAARLIEAVI